MADRKISDLTALTTPASGDYLPIVDISEAAAASKNKRITIEELMRGVPDGTAAAPGIAFETYPSTGIYSPGANQLAVATNGTQRLTVDTAATTSTLPVVHPLGAVGTPSITFTGDLNTGIYSPSADTLAFVKGGSEATRIDSSGRLLVGTSSAVTTVISAGLQVQSSGATAYASIGRWDSNAASPGLILNKSRGSSVGTRGVVQSGDILGEISFIGDDGASFIAGAQILSIVDGTPGTNDMPGRLVFFTTADGASSPTERLRITSTGVLQVADAGNITVGTTTGTKIGTATTQKLGFYNATPVVQPTAVADATTAVDVITQLNALLAKLRTLGIIAT